MAVWLAILVVVLLVVATFFYLFRKVGRVVFWFLGLMVFVGALLGIGWLSTRRDRLPFSLPKPVESLLEFVADPIYFTIDLVDGFFQILLFAPGLG